MNIPSIWSKAACLILLLGGIACTGEQVVDEPMGSLELALAQTVSGDTYRLRDASFNVTGPASFVLESEQVSPDSQALTRSVPVGTYAVALEAGWHIERVSASGVVTTPGAQIVGDPTKNVTVLQDQTAYVTYVFIVDGIEVVLGHGTLAVDIAVKGACDPFLSPSPCPSGQVCSWQRANSRGICDAPGSGPQGQLCGDSNVCQAGLACLR
jgi:hypothetical protein